MKKTVFVLLALLVSLSLSAQRFSYRGFSGGMMLHAGWIDGGDISVGGLQQSMNGVAKGIGGALKVQFGDHLRIGTEGYTSALSYGDYGSSLSVGWGGLLVDWAFENHRGRIGYFGATVGGGVVKNLTLSEEPADDFAPEDNLSFRKYGVPIVAPFVGTELPLTERMNLTVKADYLIPIGNVPDFPSGVRLYVGFMFKH